jgi:hypothetical protein
MAEVRTISWDDMPRWFLHQMGQRKQGWNRAQVVNQLP